MSIIFEKDSHIQKARFTETNHSSTTTNIVNDSFEFKVSFLVFIRHFSPLPPRICKVNPTQISE